jgi:hypothetical protein
MVTSQSYPFYILLNTSILLKTGSVGQSFLVSGMHSMKEQARAEHAAPAEGPEAAEDEQIAQTPAAPRPVSMNLLLIWVLLYGFVGTQLAWTLRPFHGDPSMPFMLFRPVESNFYLGVIQTIARLFH